MPNSKPWYQSKTVIFNGVVLLLTIALYVLQGISSGQLTLPVSPEIVALLIGIVNLVLRFFTDKPIGGPRGTGGW